MAFENGPDGLQGIRGFFSGNARRSSKGIDTDALAGFADPPKLLAVTVLTSFDQEDLADLGYPCPVSELVLLRVRKAMEAGMDGIVCSPLEAAVVRQTAGPSAILVTPGVRSAGAAKGDQKRVATPAEALRDGASYLVIGRQVTRAKEPAAEVERILEEIGCR